MEALYDFLPVPGTKNSEKSPKLYPKLVTRGAVPFSEIIRQIARSSGFKEGTVIGVMEEVEKWTSFYISRGECVEIGHMAYAVANLKAGKEITDEAKFTPRPSDSIKYGFAQARVSTEDAGDRNFPESRQNGNSRKVPPDTRKRNACTCSWSI